MKKKWLLFLATLLISLCATAADGDVFTAQTAEGIEVSYVVVSQSDFTVKVGDGTNAAVETSTAGSLTIPASVEYAEEIYNVVSISANAFAACTAITEVTIPETVKSLGANVFNGCNALESVNIPEGITSIPDATFRTCSSLKQITIPDGIKTIGNNAFSACSSLTEITIPEGVTTIGNYAFYACSSMTAATLAESIATMGVYVFAECKALNSVNIPASLKIIPDYAFYNDALTSIVIPATVKSINKSAFRGCSKLAHVYSRILNPAKPGGSAFGGVSSACGLHVPEGKKDAYIAAGWTTTMFKGGIVEGDDTPTLGFRFTLPTEEGIEVAYYVSDVDNWYVRVGSGSAAAVDVATNAEKITIPESVEYNGMTYAVKTIAAKAFANCTGIKSVVLPNSLSSIGSQAFSACSALKDVYARMENPFAFGANAFEKIHPYCGLHVSEGKKDAYIEAGWTKAVFGGGVVEGDDAPTAGSTFTMANAEGTEIFYTINDIDEMTLTVGDATNPAVSTATAGVLSIPETVEYNGQTYSVSVIAANAFNGCTGIAKAVIPATVTNIGSSAFKGCSALEEISLPEGLSVLGGSAFQNCSALKQIAIPSGVKTIAASTFNGCAAMTEVSFPQELTSIGNYAFQNCSSLKQVAIPETVQTIGVYAFAGCSSMTTANIPAALKVIQDYMFYESGITSIEIPATVTTINKSAFRGCSSLSQVYSRLNPPISFGGSAFAGIGSLCGLHVPEGTKEAYIEKGWTTAIFKGGIVYGDDALTNGYAFTATNEDGIDIVYTIVNCDAMTIRVGDNSNPAVSQQRTGSINIPESVTLGSNTYKVISVGAYAFNGCKSVTDVTMPEGVTNIGGYAFNECEGLKSVTLPQTLSTIGQYAFYQTTALTQIDLPASLKSIGTFAFAYSGLTSVDVPEGVTVIEIGTFADCYFMTKVTLPSTVTALYRQAFRHNLRLTDVTLPEGLTEMRAHVFYNCQSLKEITLPSTLTTCHGNVFYYCVSLKKVIARMTDPFPMPEQMFEETSGSISLHIPEGTHDKYVEAGWIDGIFPGGIVYGDDTPALNDEFTFTTVEGVEVTAVLTDFEKNTIQVGIGTTGNPAIDQATVGIVTLPDTVEAFGNKYVITTIGGYAFRYCNDVTEVKIPATVTHIGRYGFGNMDNLEKAVLPDSLIAMETAAFYRDAKLSELKLNEGLQDIGNYSFSYAAISELEIPKSVTNIGRSSFAACENLDKVISRIEVPFAFQSDAFTGISSTCGLHVPEGTKEAYIEQGWTEETFPGGIVYGDETLHKGQSFDVTEEDGTQKTFRVTDVNEMKAEMVSVKAGSEAGGTVTLMPTATHELTGNVYTVSSIADKAFGADVKKVLSRIETPFAVSSAAFASLSPMCSLHVPAGTKAAYLEQGWTEESFKAGVVEGDDTLVKGQTFTLTDEDGTSTTYRVTDVNDNLVEIVSAKEGEEADGRVSIQQAVTDPVAGNDYTVGSIGNGAFNENLKAVTAEAETPYLVTPEAFKGIGDKCVLFVPVGTKDAYVENGWTEDIFKGGIYEGNIPGDVNEDLAVDISDIVAVINTIADPENSTYRYADVNEDNKVDISDIVKIINIIAEK